MSLGLEEITETVIDVIRQQTGIEVVTSDMEFADVGMDSLDRVESLMAIEESFSIDVMDEVAEKWETLADVIKYIHGIIH